MRDVPAVLAALAPFPDADHAAFGPVAGAPLSKIQMLTGAYLGRNWVTIPHVTHHDEVDVSDLEARRAEWNATNPGVKITPVPVLVAVLAKVLQRYPRFNTSLAADGKSLIQKSYTHIGVAVDTLRGLLVPVLRDVDGMSVAEIAGELGALSEKARTKGLSVAEMSGGCMTVSSLGHLGGTAFTPIINGAEVAILGATAIQLRPAPSPDGGIIWRKMLPLSLSYDHRVINGADAARFVRAVGDGLAEASLR